ncbi:hypothetical protein DMC14_001095 [Metamycoplasma phocicerebrale]|uniref:Lipoprotein n=1 Tax=Metamycoplasma phocicerebrale TaxID=142649 RepID=A0A3Q9VA24_9BACT|nr:hypothetical protein [Metamycoplasma phocicerebrale]AZZ65388.1 hypothetical protein DMC14_001095 [Metamycoplasma phocicerebrale]
MKKLLLSFAISCVALSPISLVACQNTWTKDFNNIADSCSKTNSLLDVKLTKNTIFKNNKLFNENNLKEESVYFKSIAQISNADVYWKRPCPIKEYNIYKNENWKDPDIDCQDYYDHRAISKNVINQINEPYWFIFSKNGQNILTKKLNEKDANKNLLEKYKFLNFLIDNNNDIQYENFLKELNNKLDKNKNYIFVFQPSIYFNYKNINDNISKSSIGIENNKISIVQNLSVLNLFLKPSEALKASYWYNYKLDINVFEIKDNQINENNYEDFINKKLTKK